MERIEALSAVVRDANADAMLLTGAVNLIYATKQTALEGSLLVNGQGQAVLLTDGRYIEHARKTLAPNGFTVLVRDFTMRETEQMTQLLETYHIRKLLYEDNVLTVQRFRWLQEQIPCEWLPLQDRMEQLRAYKSAWELECMETAQRMAERAFTKLLPTLHTGMTEQEAAARLDYFMALEGSEKPSFDTILLFGAHASMPHGVPSERRLAVGDCILADFGATYRGYHSDMTRTLAYGTASDRLRTVYETVLQAQAAAIAAAKAGDPCKAMHLAAEQVIADAGFGAQFTHALGHSVGLEIHEFPTASKRVETLLADGVVMTVEPGIYLPDELGVRIEDMVVIAGNHPRNLTQYEKAFTILPENIESI